MDVLATDGHLAVFWPYFVYRACAETAIIIIIHFISGTWSIEYRTHREEKKKNNKQTQTQKLQITDELHC